MITDTPEPFDARGALIGRERIRGASRIIAEGTDAARVTAEQVTQVAADVEIFCRTHKIARAVVAKAIGYSPGVVSEFLKGQYKGAVGQVAIDLDAWISLEEERRNRPQTTQFVWTNVAMEIKAVAGYCLDYKKIGLCYGPDTAGIGKTTALQAIHQELGPRRSSLATIDKVDANPTGLLKKLCRSMHVDDTGTNKRRFDRLVAALSGRSHLLMIDQAHSLRWAREDRPFYILSDLFDATKAAQLWVSTADLVTYLQRQQTRNLDESLTQVRRRVFPCVDLMESLRGGGGGGKMLISVEQVREMFDRNKLRLTGAASRWLCAICNQPDSGAVGLCVQVVEYATMMGEIKGLTTLDVPLLQESLRRGFSPKRADALLHRIEIESPAAGLKVG
jgi:DNA transposition AAA+ family ATPase